MSHWEGSSKAGGIEVAVHISFWSMLKGGSLMGEFVLAIKKKQTNFIICL